MIRAALRPREASCVNDAADAELARAAPGELDDSPHGNERKHCSVAAT
jgi:hypothetical protein